MLMHEFSHQNALVLADVYPYEVKLAAYYASTLKVLTHPRFRTDDDSVTFATTAFRQLRAVANPWHQPQHHRKVGGEQLVTTLGESVPTRLASVFRNIVLDYYGIVAVKQKKIEARFFAEKLNLNSDLRHAVRELFGSVKEIVLSAIRVITYVPQNRSGKRGWWTEFRRCARNYRLSNGYMIRLTTTFCLFAMKTWSWTQCRPENSSTSF